MLKFARKDLLEFYINNLTEYALSVNSVTRLQLLIDENFSNFINFPLINLGRRDYITSDNTIGCIIRQ